MIEYKLVRSSRKTLCIEIDREGNVVVRAPRWCSVRQIEEFVTRKERWITEKSARQKEKKKLKEPRAELTEEQKHFYRQKAREVLGQRVQYYAKVMDVTYGRIAIREQKTRWGSCSAKGNLNFNWKLILMPPGVLDYVVAHELAHRREMNHSGEFWKLVEAYMPEYRKYRNWLKENGSMIDYISLW